MGGIGTHNPHILEQLSSQFMKIFFFSTNAWSSSYNRLQNKKCWFGVQNRAEAKDFDELEKNVELFEKIVFVFSLTQMRMISY